MRSLRPYQAEAVEFLLAHQNAALFMEMRLGKTLCVIRAMRSHPDGCILVVAPLVALWAWKRELELEGEKDYVLLLGSADERCEASKGQRWQLINYEGLRTVPQLLQINWKAVVLDESRRIANPKAQTTKLLQRYGNSSSRRILLSGNPAPESPLEYFEQFRFLNGRFLGCENYWSFRHSLFHPLGPYEWVPKRGAVDRIKTAVHREAFVLTRKQAGIGEEKVYERRVVELPAEAKRLYEGVRKDFVARTNGVERSTKWVPVQYLWLQQIASGHVGNVESNDAKVRELLSLLQGELQGEQVVVWYRFNFGIAVSEVALRSARIPYGRIVGLDRHGAREKAINEFRLGKTRVLLCQVACASMGIDLSNSSTAIYFSNTLSYEGRIQSEDRILNPAKQEPLLYIDLVARGTVDEDIVEVLRSKKVESRFFLTTLLEKLKHERSKNLVG
jgi:SNF2 family DNA or RNA helicase